MNEMPTSEGWFFPVLYGFSSIVGIVTCFFGYKLFRSLLTVLVALALAALGAYLGYSIGNDPVWWSIGGAVAGLIAGIIFGVFFYSLAVATTGASAAALFVLPLLERFPIVWQWVSLGIVAGIAALLSVYLTNLIIQLATAFIGAFLTVYSIGYFITGEAFYRLVQESEELVVQLTPTIMINLIALGTAVLGFLFQRLRFKPSDE